MLNSSMTLDGLMFDNFFFYPFLVMVRFVRSKTSICPDIFYDVIMHEVFKGGVF